MLAPKGPAAFGKAAKAPSPKAAGTRSLGRKGEKARPYGDHSTEESTLDMPAPPDGMDAPAGDKTVDMPAPPGALEPAAAAAAPVAPQSPAGAPGRPFEAASFEVEDTDVNVIEPPGPEAARRVAPEDDPMELLRRALGAAGRDPTKAAHLVASHSQSGRRLREDLVALALARRIYEQLVSAGRAELQHDLARLCVLEAGERQAAGDSAGASTLADRAIVIWEGFAEAGDHGHDRDLARAFVVKAQSLDSGEVTSRVALYDRAMQIQERLVAATEAGAAMDLARTLMAKGVALGYLGDPGSAVGAFDQACSLWLGLVEGGAPQHVDDLARAYMNKGVALEQLGEIRVASELYTHAVALWRPMVESGSHPDLAGDLGWTLAYSAAAFKALGRPDVASLHAREAVALLAAEIDRTGRADLVDVIAWARSDLASLL